MYHQVGQGKSLNRTDERRKLVTRTGCARLVLRNRLRVVPLSLIPSCMTRKKKNGRVKSWGREARDHFFLAVFVRVTHDGLSERGTTRSLAKEKFPAKFLNSSKNICTKNLKKKHEK